MQPCILLYIETNDKLAMPNKTIINATMSADGAAVMEIMDGIGAYGYTLRQWTEAHTLVKDAAAVTLRINSGGGEVVEALAIADAIRTSGQRFTCEVYGMCGSAATLIALACESVHMAPSARWMVHEPTFGVRGTYAEVQAMLSTFEQLRRDIFDLYATCTGKTPEQLMADHATDRYYTAAEAVAYGWVQGVIGMPSDGDQPQPQNGNDERPETATATAEVPADTPAEAATPSEDGNPQPEAAEDEPEQEPVRLSAASRLLALLGMRSALQKQADAAAYWQARARKAEAHAIGVHQLAEVARRDAAAAVASAQEESAARINAEVAARMASMGFSGELPSPVEKLPARTTVALAELRRTAGADAAIDAAAAALRS